MRSVAYLASFSIVAIASIASDNTPIPSCGADEELSDEASLLQVPARLHTTKSDVLPKSENLELLEEDSEVQDAEDLEAEAAGSQVELGPTLEDCQATAFRNPLCPDSELAEGLRAPNDQECMDDILPSCEPVMDWVSTESNGVRSYVQDFCLGTDPIHGTASRAAAFAAANGIQASSVTSSQFRLWCCMCHATDEELDTIQGRRSRVDREPAGPSRSSGGAGVSQIITGDYRGPPFVTHNPDCDSESINFQMPVSCGNRPAADQARRQRTRRSRRTAREEAEDLAPDSTFVGSVGSVGR